MVPTSVDIHVGRKLRYLRMMRNLSQKAVASHLGLSFQQIQKYETGANRIAASRLFDLAGFFGVSLTFFFEDLGGRPGGIDARSELENLRMVRYLSKIKSRRIRGRLLSLIREIAHQNAT
ncbi:MAG: helix-turn-helix transcriptional regulator [Pseudomonadota bacterium]